ncbi:hypothetical protein BVY04_04185 [bacterium M21]|nr:hypothetical protein BVY04_04185 [bacterium M21]
MNHTPYLPGFSPKGGRRRLSPQDKLKQKALALQKYTIDSYQNLFHGLLPKISLVEEAADKKTRRRIYTREVTFCAFLSQIFNWNSSCREAVKLVQSCFCIDGSTAKVSSNTAAYCKARARLPLDWLVQQFQHITKHSAAVPPDKLWHGRSVKMIDGTSFRLSDTSENQAEWPQSSNQKEGCGFPRIQVQGLICLASGALLDWVETALTVHDSLAWQPLWEFFSANDIILADRAYGSFYCFATLRKKQVDMVTRLMQRRKIDPKRSQRLGKNDWLTTWKKPSGAGRK